MLLVDARGIPLSIIVTAANHHDVTQLEPVLDGLVVRRPRVSACSRQHLCADAAFYGAPAEQAIRRRRYVPHVRSRFEEHRTRRASSAAALGSRSRSLLVQSLSQTAGTLREDASLLPRTQHARRSHHLLSARAGAHQHYLRISS
jgi:IS5 family transposase